MPSSLSRRENRRIVSQRGRRNNRRLPRRRQSLAREVTFDVAPQTLTSERFVDFRNDFWSELVRAGKPIISLLISIVMTFLMTCFLIEVLVEILSARLFFR